MSRREQLERVFEIDRQVRTGLYPNADSLAAQLEVGRRVIFNDRRFLLDRLGAPLANSRQRKGWYYTDLSWTLPTAVVTRGELLTFLLAIEAAQRQLGPDIEAELRTAIEKLARGLQGSVEVDLDALRRHFTFAAPIAVATPFSTVLALREAANRCQRIRMDYFTASRTERAWRQVEPYHLHHAGDIYLFAFDPKHGQVRTFHTARIRQFQVLDETFARDPDWDVERYLAAGFRTELGPQTFEAVVRFDAYQATYARERTIHPTQQLEDLPDGGALIRFEASGLNEIVRWVLQYGAHAEVLGPPALRQAVFQAIRDMNTLYEETP